KIHNAPQFYVQGVSRFDLLQGKVGNCWFVAALAALTMQEELFVHFWYFGDWVDVVVDDRLPVSERAELIFAKSSAPNEFWCALLEKAYAKLNGSYGDLQMGHISDALVDITGGIKTNIFLKDPPSDLWVRMKRAIDLGSFMGCGTASVNSKELTLPNGMVLTHAYTVTGVEEVPYKNRIEQLIRIRNPWGNDVEWNERWSDRSVQWNRIDPRIKANLLIMREDGEFWMALQDFKRNFVSLVICNLTPDFLKGANQQKWSLSIHHGIWLKGQSAGGPINNKEMFSLNPQYCVTLTESDMDKETNSCTFISCLLQKPSARCRNENSNSGIACFLFKVPPTFQVQNGKLPPTLLDERYLVKRLQFNPTREVSEVYELRPSTYVLVPCTYKPNEEKEFLLRAYFQRGSLQNHPSFNFNLQHPTPALNRNDNSVWKQIFDKYAQVSVVNRLSVNDLE
ncbi:hypothetical protein scyTo_0018769, partial [Scyliorhinus torazame]|nr:hypothetical protein [Scyliorhinus torazame]